MHDHKCRKQGQEGQNDGCHNTHAGHFSDDGLYGLGHSDAKACQHRQEELAHKGNREAQAGQGDQKEAEGEEEEEDPDAKLAELHEGARAKNCHEADRQQEVRPVGSDGQKKQGQNQGNPGVGCTAFLTACLEGAHAVGKHLRPGNAQDNDQEGHEAGKGHDHGKGEASHAAVAHKGAHDRCAVRVRAKQYASVPGKQHDHEEDHASHSVRVAQAHHVAAPQGKEKASHDRHKAVVEAAGKCCCTGKEAAQNHAHDVKVAHPGAAEHAHGRKAQAAGKGHWPNKVGSPHEDGQGHEHKAGCECHILVETQAKAEDPEASQGDEGAEVGDQGAVEAIHEGQGKLANAPGKVGVDRKERLVCRMRQKTEAVHALDDGEVLHLCRTGHVSEIGGSPGKEGQKDKQGHRAHGGKGAENAIVAGRFGSFRRLFLARSHIGVLVRNLTCKERGGVGIGLDVLSLDCFLLGP